MTIAIPPSPSPQAALAGQDSRARARRRPDAAGSPAAGAPGTAAIGQPSKREEHAVRRTVFSQEHEDFRAMVRDFIANEVAPCREERETLGHPPREFYARLGNLGVRVRSWEKARQAVTTAASLPRRCSSAAHDG